MVCIVFDFVLCLIAFVMHKHVFGFDCKFVFVFM